MKSHSRSRDLPGRPAPLRPARIGLRVGQTSLTTNRNSRFTNHQSLSTLHSSLVTQRRRILIGSRPLLEIKLARSQQKRKLFLTGGFFAVLSLKGFGAIRDAGREDNLWEQLGRDITNGTFHAPDFAAELRLTGQPVQLLPLPLLAD